MGESARSAVDAVMQFCDVYNTSFPLLHLDVSRDTFRTRGLSYASPHARRLVSRYLLREGHDNLQYFMHLSRPRPEAAVFRRGLVEALAGQWLSRGSQGQTGKKARRLTDCDSDITDTHLELNLPSASDNVVHSCDSTSEVRPADGGQTRLWQPTRKSQTAVAPAIDYLLVTETTVLFLRSRSWSLHSCWLQPMCSLHKASTRLASSNWCT